MVNSEKKYNILLGKLAVGELTQEERSDLIETIQTFEELLDEADRDDYFGTEGWRHRLGWD